MFKVGQKVRIVHYDPEFNGMVGTLIQKNGEYHYVEVPLFDSWSHDNSLELEVYANELELVEQEYFREELFEI